MSAWRRVERIYRRARHPFDRLWAWAKGRGPFRWHVLARWATSKARFWQRRHKWKIARGWVLRATVYRRRYRRAKERQQQQGGQPQFESWMLNGCPGNITPEAKEAVARAVVTHGCVVTATTNGTHASTSFHYPWNNRLHGYSDDYGHAVDFGGSYAAYAGFYAAEKGRGCANYDELFGPGSGYCDHRALVVGAAPDNPNHCHCAPVHHE